MLDIHSISTAYDAAATVKKKKKKVLIGLYKDGFHEYSYIHGLKKMEGKLMQLIQTESTANYQWIFFYKILMRVIQ